MLSSINAMTTNPPLEPDKRHMIARAAVVGRDHAVEGLIGDREQRVAAEHCREHRVLMKRYCRSA